MIDTKNCQFTVTKNGTTYEMTKGDASGNYFLVNKISVGLALFNIKNGELRINNFIIKDELRGMGFGRIFYELLKEYAKTQFDCKKVIAKELTGEGNGFFGHMGLNNTDGKKYPDMRWGSI